MRCPNCDFDYTDGLICPSCQIDPVLYTRTVKISDILYNNGLMRAKNQDLSGAAEYLTKSIEFNKNNVTARNLLGLVYYDRGHVGDALKQWIISVSLLKERNPAVHYIDDLQKNSRALEKFNDAIKMYNQALMYIKQKSDDMALIQLKKAVEINPRFVDAHNLLTFCYLIQNDQEKAIACVEKVLAIDVNNSIALKYYNEIFPAKSRLDIGQRAKKSAQPVTSIQPPSYTRLSPSDEKKLGSNFHFAEILSFIIGALCGFAIVYALVLPPALSAKDQKIDELSTTTIAVEQSLRDELREKENQLQQSKDENAQLSQSNQALTAQVALYEKMQKVSNATQLFEENKLEEAADIFFTLDLTGLPQDMLESAQETKASALADASAYLYNQGVRDYNSGNNEAANNKLEKALRLTDPESGQMDNILYYLGLIAEESDDIASAKRYYERIINEYPNSAQLSKARNRLDRLS